MNLNNTGFLILPLQWAIFTAMETEEYKTVSEYSKIELKIKGSRFIGQVFPVESANEAEGILEQCRKEYHDATHRCYAYRIGIDGSIARFSDDGEPSGTAGKPIASILEHNEVTNVLLIVIRYFGGIKLGTGGLVRAYTETTQEVLASAKIITIPVLQDIRLTFPYDYTSSVMRVIAHYNIKIQDTDYSEDVTLLLGIQPSLLQTIQTQLRDATSGNIAIKHL